jgi:hypothetical protein
VLNVISRAPNTLQPVLDTIVQTAARLCAAEFSVVFRLYEGKCHIVAGNAQDEFIEFLKEHPIIPTRASCTGRAVLEQRTVHVLDASTDPEYAMPDYQFIAKNRTMLGDRTALRRDRTGPCDFAQARAHDGRGRHRHERAGERLGVHGAPAGRREHIRL